MTVKKVQDKFNEYIRLRDTGGVACQCISCPAIVYYKNNVHASHYHSAGNFKSLRFNEDNCHVSCIKCNTYLSGNLLEYRKGLIKKIGIVRVEKLELLAAASKRSVWKPMEFELQYIFDEYKLKIKELKNQLKAVG